MQRNRKNIGVQMLVIDGKTAKETYPSMEVHGDPNAWICIAKAATNKWMKSTKAMVVPGLGVLVQVTTEISPMQPGVAPCIAEALTFVPGACVVEVSEGIYQLQSYAYKKINEAR
jgi:hypothetical protein